LWSRSDYLFNSYVGLQGMGGGGWLGVVAVGPTYPESCNNLSNSDLNQAWSRRVEPCAHKSDLGVSEKDEQKIGANSAEFLNSRPELTS